MFIAYNTRFTGHVAGNRKITVYRRQRSSALQSLGVRGKKFHYLISTFNMWMSTGAGPNAAVALKNRRRPWESHETTFWLSALLT